MTNMLSWEYDINRATCEEINHTNIIVLGPSRVFAQDKGIVHCSDYKSKQFQQVRRKCPF